MTCQTPYIFITGIFRSGTTLLARALSAHHDVHVFYQPFAHFFKYAMSKFWQHNGYLQPRPMGDPLLIEKFYKQFMDNVLSMTFNESEIESIKKGIWEDFAIDSVEKSMDACRAFDNASGVTFFELLQSAIGNLRHVISEKRCAIWGIKEIWCEDFLPAFVLQDSIVIKCIHLIRDPRAVIVSRNYGTYLEKGCGGQKYPVLFIARSWRRSVQYYRKLYGARNYFLVRYEDLVNFPERVLKQISDFLGIPFDPIMLDYRQYRGGDGQPWRGNTNSRQLDFIDKNGSFRWKKIISEDDLLLCEFLCSKEMESIGYELISNYTDVERFLSIEEDESSGKSWLCAYDHCLNKEQKRMEMNRKKELA